MAAPLPLPVNRFKAGLAEGRLQWGIWNAIPGPVVSEALAACGYDWVVIDTEHGPLEPTDVLPALQAMGGYPGCAPVVRPAINDPVLFKRLLDMGAQTLLVPYVQSADEARAAVQAMRYPPRGIRGVAGVTRASRFGLVDDYIGRAEAELCLIVQVETRDGLDRLEEIAGVEGVDAVFIGPADLAASLGHPGDMAHPEVVAAIEGAFARLNAIGVPGGILATDPAYARRCAELGAAFVALAVDAGLLTRAALDLLDGMRADPA
ncbi:HpcH/HpaI aldolase family protein [Rhodovulum adriaticum]|uniref:Hydroxypyruvate/pyruvate aldolase n=1 Tax=Rhodovulum adriaticum TaxID=35804 RepID=A0A4R2NMH0_RHOAD|nr:2,4-dihydroxyhept-2-enedioate aldolase [Rhodovulum adriaticum]